MAMLKRNPRVSWIAANGDALSFIAGIAAFVLPVVAAVVLSN